MLISKFYFTIFRSVVCNLWCVLARIAKRHIEGVNSANEGTSMRYNFKTSESILAFPFNLFMDDQKLVKLTILIHLFIQK